MSYSSPIPYIIETLQEIKRLLLSGQQELRTGNDNDNGNNNGNDDKKREREEELEVSSNKKMKKNDC
jgi:hypothetical protein